MNDRLVLTIALALTAASACNCSHQGAGPPSPAPLPNQRQGARETVPKAPGASIELPPVPEADPREPMLAVVVPRLLQNGHLTARGIDDAVLHQAVEYYLERLDPAKQFLLKPQTQALLARSAGLREQLVEGDLSFARLGTALLAQQRAKVAGMVKRLTRQPFDLTDSESFESDPKKRDFADTDEALEDLWRRNLERHVLERVERMRKASEFLAEAEESQDKGKGNGTPGVSPQTQTAGKAGKPGKPGQNRAHGDNAQGTGKSRAKEGTLPTTDPEREEKARTDLAETLAGRFQRYAEAASLEAIETFTNALTAVYGPHTLFMAPDDKANFDIQMTGSLEGIGAVLTEGDHLIEVREVVPGGAAWRQGDLEAGDLISAVAQAGSEPTDVTDMRIGAVVKMIRGPKGTLVTLFVRKPDGRLTSIVIKRDVVAVEATYARGAMLNLPDKGARVGYIYLPSFYGNTRPGATNAGRNATGDVRAILGRFNKQKLETVVLDLRGNGGGLLSQATGVVGLFIKEGPVVQVRRADGELEVLNDDDPSIAFEGRLLIMVDRLSASASEIVAGALQDYDRALVVGTGPTHGKGTVQMMVDLDRIVPRSPGPLGVLKLTIQQYFLVDGDSTQQRGVRPALVLPDPLSYLEVGERFLENPVPFGKIDGLAHNDWTGPGWDVELLAALSQTRQRQSEVFAHIIKRGTYLEARKDDTLLPLRQQDFRARIEAQAAALEAFEQDAEELPPGFTVTPLRYGAVRRGAANGKDARAAANERLERWRKQLERDPWVEHVLHLVQVPKREDR